MAGEPCILLLDDDLKVQSVLTRALQSGRISSQGHYLREEST